MVRTQDRITAHLRRLSQDDPRISTLVFTEKQLLELVSVATVALREKAKHAHGYHFAIWKRRVGKCTATPPCEGGDADIVLH